jgi:glutathione S-transferase
VRVLYGSARSRASRSLLALEALGLDYEHRPVRQWESAADMQTVATLNPNRRVPILDDEGLVVWESMAINLYLGDRYGGPLWPADAKGRARLYQWTLWSQTEMDVPARQVARTRGDAAAKAKAEAERLRALKVLDEGLAGRDFLTGPAFTLADLNVAASLSEPWERGLIEGDLDPKDHGLDRLAAWLARCLGQPAWEKVRRLA